MEFILKTVPNNIITKFFSYFGTNGVNQQNTAEVSFLHKLLITKKVFNKEERLQKELLGTLNPSPIRGTLRTEFWPKKSNPRMYALPISLH